MNISVVWFRSDLRLDDNPVVRAAVDALGAPGVAPESVRTRRETPPSARTRRETPPGARTRRETPRPPAMLPSALCTVWAPPQSIDAQTSHGFPRIGAFRRRFLAESVADLAGELARHGVAFAVLSRPAATALPAWLEERLEAWRTVAREEPVTVSIYAQREAYHEEMQEAAAVSEALRVLGERHGASITLQLVEGQMLYDPDRMPFTPETMPLVYSDFRRAIEHALEPTAPLPAPELPPTPSWCMAAAPAVSVASATSAASTTERVREVLGVSHDEPLPDPRAALHWSGGATAASERLTAWMWEGDHLRRYKETRNGLIGADYSSKLSPYLAVGALSPRRIAAEVRRYEAERVRNRSTYWLIFELIWRDYFVMLARRFPVTLYRPGGPRELSRPWRYDRDRFVRWCNGETGQPFIDANMRELKATGYMSNRGRQNVASYLARDLGVVWTWGAEWFESLLIDYDPASNWGNWTYNAGVGTDPREDRWFNAEIQAARYDPRGDYVRRWMRS